MTLKLHTNLSLLVMQPIVFPSKESPNVVDGIPLEYKHVMDVVTASCQIIRHSNIIDW